MEPDLAMTILASLGDAGSTHERRNRRTGNMGKALTKAWRVVSNMLGLANYAELPCPGGINTS